MDINVSCGYSKISNSIYRKEANLKGKAPHILAYLQTHKEGYNLSLRKIAKDTYSDFRTVKKYLDVLIIKGYSDVVKKVLPKYNSTIIDSTLKNNSTNASAVKLQHHDKSKLKSSIESNSSKNFCSNKVLLNNNTSAVKLQHPPLLNNSTRINNKNKELELIKANNFLTLSYEKIDKRSYNTVPQKQLPVFVESEVQEEQSTKQLQPVNQSNQELKPITLKQQPITDEKKHGLNINRNGHNSVSLSMDTNKLPEQCGNRFSKNVNGTGSVEKESTSQTKLKNGKTTSASELPLTIPLQFVELGKTINQYLDLANEYELFRANKIQKQHTNNNWLNAWKSWLENGVKKYGKNQQSFLLMHKEQQMNSEVKPLIELSELEKQSKMQQLKQLAKEYHNKEEEINNKAFNLKMESHKVTDLKEKQTLRNKASCLEWELIEENKKAQEEFLKLSAGLNLVNHNDFDSYYNNFKHKIYKDNLSV